MAAKTVEQNLEKMTVKELRELAKAIPGLTGVSSMKKDELLAALQGGGSEEQAEAPKKNPAQKAKKEAGPSIKNLTAKEVKQRINATRDKKAAALEEKNKKMIAVLRRKLSRLKKQSRKKSAPPAQDAPAA
ncbi:Rho termination factor N-terminal domain-containing protein [Thiovibrio sp. JS02]